MTGSCFSADTRLNANSRYEYCMRTLLIQIICLALATQFVISCTTMQTDQPVPEHTPTQTQRAAVAELALLKMDEIDALVKLDNEPLGRQIASVLREQASESGDFYFRQLDIHFNRQWISLTSTVDIADGTGNIVRATAAGDILLEFSGNSLQWFPLFSELHITSTDFNYADGAYAESIPELDQLALDRLNTNVTDALLLYDNNTIPLDAIPLADIEVGAALSTLSNITATQTQALKGIFIVAGSATMIEPDATSIALDLEFIPDFSVCPADISVSRSVFVREIKSREPRGLIRNMGDLADLQHFYSEISGAKRPMTIIHYWFADGQPWVVKELAVGPSERWRTWSSRGTDHTDASHWRVLVVEKESGCILHSQSVHTLETEAQENISEDGESSVVRNFTTLNDAFAKRTSEFSIVRDKPGIALIEIRRDFLQDVFRSSVSDLNIEARFDPRNLPKLHYTAQMLPIELEDDVCADTSCPEPEVCPSSTAICKRLRDTRDCTTCLFHNPLNNRCIKQAIDPICEGNRNEQNEKYDADHKACKAAVESAKRKCEEKNAQRIRSCEIESGAERSTCQAVKAGIESIKEGARFADVSAETNITGELSAVFSDFQIVGDFQRIQQDIALKFDIELNGDLLFSTGDIPDSVASCLKGWQAPFNNHATNTISQTMLTPLNVGESMLTSSWSGLVIPIAMSPSPLESVFVGNPRLLANCGVKLTVDDVVGVIVGEQADFFSGRINLIVQPLPTRIKLSPATIIYGETTHESTAVLNDKFLRYDIKK